VSGLRAAALHVEQAIRSAIKIHLLRLVGILFPHNSFSVSGIGKNSSIYFVIFK
jgi:hypothetical protein